MPQKIKGSASPVARGAAKVLTAPISQAGPVLPPANGPALLRSSNASFESGLSPWTAINGAVTTQSSDWAADGLFSMKVVGSGAANPGAQSEFLPVTAGLVYMAPLVLHCNQGYPAQVAINWFNSSFTPMGPSSVSAVVALQPKAGQLTIAQGQAPATAVWATISAYLYGNVPTGTLTGKFGAYLNPADYQPSGSIADAVLGWQTVMWRSLDCRRVYYSPGFIPGGIDDGGLTNDLDSGRKVLISLMPAANPPTSSQLLALGTFLANIKASGITADVALWHEPYSQGLSPALYKAMIAFYGPTVRTYYPLVYCQSNWDVVQNGANVAYYPGDSAVDKIAVDVCASQYQSHDYVTTQIPTNTQQGILNPVPFQSVTAPVPFQPGVPIQINWTVTLAGTVSGSDANNFQLNLFQDGLAFDLLAISVNPGAAGTYPQKPVIVTPLPGAGPLVLLVKGTTPTSGAIYGGTVTSNVPPTATQTTTPCTLDLAAQLADNASPPKTLALWEVGAGGTQLDNTAFLQYLFYWLQQRYAAGKALGDMAWYNDPGAGGLVAPTPPIYTESYENGNGNWVPIQNCSTSVVTSQFHSGAHSLQGTVTLTNPAQIIAGPLPNGPVQMSAGRQYLVMSWWRATAAGRTVQQAVSYVDANGNNISGRFGLTDGNVQAVPNGSFGPVMDIFTPVVATTNVPVLWGIFNNGLTSETFFVDDWLIIPVSPPAGGGTSSTLLLPPAQPATIGQVTAQAQDALPAYVTNDNTPGGVPGPASYLVQLITQLYDLITSSTGTAELYVDMWQS